MSVLLQDIENGPVTSSQPEVREGFAAAAEWMVGDCDSETFVARKFDDVGARNLFYLQCEILLLRKRLVAYDQRAAQDEAAMDLKDAARTWEVLVAQCEAGEPDSLEHMRLILELRKKIKEYVRASHLPFVYMRPKEEVEANNGAEEALVLQSQVAQLKRPSDRALAASRAWASGGPKLRPDGTKLLPSLGGVAKDLLDDGKDIVTLRLQTDEDYLSRKLRELWPIKAEPVRDGLLHIGRFEERSITRAAGIISTLVSAILLLGSITALYFVQVAIARLFMIYIFTTLFALSVALTTNARRAELFAATAAYAAVLVVFVSNGIAGPT